MVEATSNIDSSSTGSMDTSGDFDSGIPKEEIVEEDIPKAEEFKVKGNEAFKSKQLKL